MSDEFDQIRRAPAAQDAIVELAGQNLMTVLQLLGHTARALQPLLPTIKTGSPTVIEAVHQIAQNGHKALLNGLISAGLVKQTKG